MTPLFTSDATEVSARMKLIRGRDTKPELRLFAILTKANIAFHPHRKVEGITVDALVGDRITVFVDSPFWHLKDKRELDRLSCHWRTRLLRNYRRDRRQDRKLRAAEYGVLRFWADELDEQRILRRIREMTTRLLLRPLPDTC